MDLPLDLPPAEYKAAHVLSRAIRLRTVEVAELVGVSQRQAQRILSVLVARGLAVQETRGLYRSPMSAGATRMSPEATLVSPDWSVYKPNSQVASATETATQSLVGGDIPPRGTEGNVIPLRRYDDDDHLAVEGDLSTPEEREAERTRPRRSTRKVPEMHRNVPREQWTMAYVAKEFRHRVMRMAPPSVATWREAGIINPTDGNRLAMILQRWQVEYGITPREAAEAVDRFFDDPEQTSRITNAVPAYRLYLEYLKRSIDDIRSSGRDDDYREYTLKQVLPWS